jgi:hypothetical protein
MPHWSDTRHPEQRRVFIQQIVDRREHLPALFIAGR